jgi:hypothetical protein
MQIPNDYDVEKTIAELRRYGDTGLAEMIEGLVRDNSRLAREKRKARKEALKEVADSLDSVYRAKTDEHASPTYLRAFYDACALVHALGGN